MENNIILYGASGHCKVIIDIIENSNCNIEAIIDDDPNKKSIMNYSITNSSDIDINGKKVIISIGNNKVRKKLDQTLNTEFETAIHPKAIISKHSKINKGTVVMAGVIINSDAIIGKHCIINTGAIIEHDCVIGDYAHISPNASLAGGVQVGEGSQVGIGASVIQGVKIGKWVIIGAGSVIINDIPDNAVVVGNPGKIIKFNK